ncbi:MAG: Pr6Pr family membrane protein, partial [Erysipelotrichaceae bacterium]
GFAPIFKAFTIQSNVWIAAICLVFLLYNLSGRDDWSIPAWLYNIKFMLTVDITLTYLVFAVLLTPLMSVRFLSSPANFFQHNLTSILALLDFMLCDRPYASKAKHIWLSLIMPLLYAVYFFSTYELTGIMPVAYFFLDYKKLGWFSIGGSGLGVGIWIIMLCGLLLLIGLAILKLKNICQKRPLITSFATILVMLGASMVFLFFKISSS